MKDNQLKCETFRFRAEQQKRYGQAMQRAALQIIAKIDLDEVLTASADIQRAAIRKVRRLIERERLKGTGKHWSYDLNRHIALKQALDRLKQSCPV